MLWVKWKLLSVENEDLQLIRALGSGRDQILQVGVTLHARGLFTFSGESVLCCLRDPGEIPRWWGMRPKCS